MFQLVMPMSWPIIREWTNTALSGKHTHFAQTNSRSAGSKLGLPCYHEPHYNQANAASTLHYKLQSRVQQSCICLLQKTRQGLHKREFNLGNWQWQRGMNNNINHHLFCLFPSASWTDDFVSRSFYRLGLLIFALCVCGDTWWWIIHDNDKS